MSTGRRVYLSEERSSRSGKPKAMFDPLDSELAGEGNGQATVEAQVIENQARLNRKRAKKRKEQRNKGTKET
jgi:hypothetical protein